MCTVSGDISLWWLDLSTQTNLIEWAQGKKVIKQFKYIMKFAIFIKAMFKRSSVINVQMLKSSLYVNVVSLHVCKHCMMNVNKKVRKKK